MDPSAPGNWQNWLLFHNCKSIGHAGSNLFNSTDNSWGAVDKELAQGVKNKAERFVVSGQLKSGLKGTRCIRGGTLMLIKD